MQQADMPLTPSTYVAEGARAMALLGAAVFVVALGYGAGLPLLQLYLVQYLGSAEPQRVAWHVRMLGGVYTTERKAKPDHDAKLIE